MTARTWLLPFAGAAGWTAQLAAVFAFGSAACRMGGAGALPTLGVTAIAAAAALVGLALSLRDGAAAVGARRFVARTGACLNGLFLFLIALGGAGGLVLHPCH
jgi:hypothetical protein